MYDAPYRVEIHRTYGSHNHVHTEYAIYKTGEGALVTGTDLVLMHKIIDLLNKDEADRRFGQPHHGHADGEDIHR